MPVVPQACRREIVPTVTNLLTILKFWSQVHWYTSAKMTNSTMKVGFSILSMLALTHGFTVPGPSWAQTTKFFQDTKVSPPGSGLRAVMDGSDQIATTGYQDLDYLVTKSNSYTQSMLVTATNIMRADATAAARKGVGPIQSSGVYTFPESGYTVRSPESVDLSQITTTAKADLDLGGLLEEMILSRALYIDESGDNGGSEKTTASEVDYYIAKQIAGVLANVATDNFIGAVEDSLQIVNEAMSSSASSSKVTQDAANYNIANIQADSFGSPGVYVQSMYFYMSATTWEESSKKSSSRVYDYKWTTSIDRFGTIPSRMIEYYLLGKTGRQHLATESSSSDAADLLSIASPGNTLPPLESSLRSGEGRPSIEELSPKAFRVLSRNKETYDPSRDKIKTRRMMTRAMRDGLIPRM